MVDDGALRHEHDLVEAVEDLGRRLVHGDNHGGASDLRARSKLAESRDDAGRREGIETGEGLIRR